MKHHIISFLLSLVIASEILTWLYFRLASALVRIVL